MAYIFAKQTLTGIIAEHASDIVNLLMWAISGLFAVLVVLGGVIATFIKAGFNGVKAEVAGIKREVSEDRKAMLEIIRSYDSRITRIETSCEIHHNRRANDAPVDYFKRSE